MDKSVDQSDVLLEQLLSGITGKKMDISSPERAKLEEHLQGIKEGYEERWPRLTSAEARQRKAVLLKMLKKIAQLCKLGQQLGPDGEQEIALAGKNRIVFGPDLDDDELKATLMFTTYPGLVGAAVEIYQKNIRFLLDCHEYHKGPLRTVVIEPFLIFLDRFDLWESAQPLTSVMRTLFDWLGVEQKYRLTDPGIRAIVHEFKCDDFHPDFDAFERRLEELKRQVNH
jgi:hypothetical protein